MTYKLQDFERSFRKVKMEFLPGKHKKVRLVENGLSMHGVIIHMEEVRNPEGSRMRSGNN